MANGQQLPIFYRPTDIARMLGWNVRRTRRWLRRAGCIERRHGLLVTTPESLALAFPEIFRRLIDDEEF